jgi:hypothetical protein
MFSSGCPLAQREYFPPFTNHLSTDACKVNLACRPKPSSTLRGDA